MDQIRVRGVILLVVVAVVIAALFFLTPQETPQALLVVTSPEGIISGTDLVYFGVIVVGILAKQVLDSWFEVQDPQIRACLCDHRFLPRSASFRGSLDPNPQHGGHLRRNLPRISIWRWLAIHRRCDRKASCEQPPSCASVATEWRQSASLNSSP